MIRATIPLVDPGSLLSLFGAGDQHVKRIRDVLAVDITHRDGKIHVAGDQPVAVSQATEALEQLKTLVERRGVVDEQEVAEVLAVVTGAQAAPRNVSIDVAATGRQVRRMARVKSGLEKVAIQGLPPKKKPHRNSTDGAAMFSLW